MNQNHEKNRLFSDHSGDFERPPADRAANHADSAQAGPFSAREIRAIGQTAAALGILVIVLLLIATIKW